MSNPLRVLLTAAVGMTVLSGCSGGPDLSGVRPPTTTDSRKTEVLETVPDPRPALLLKRISLDVEDVPQTEVAAQLARVGSISIVADKDVRPEFFEKQVSVRLKNVLVGSALYWVLEAGGLTYYFHHGQLVMTTPERVGAEQAIYSRQFRAELDRTWRPKLEKRLLRQKLSCDLADVPLPDVLDFLTRHYRVNCIASSGLLRKNVTLDVERLPMVEVLDVMAKTLGARWTLEHEVVHFTPL